MKTATEVKRKSTKCMEKYFEAIYTSLDDEKITLRIGIFSDAGDFRNSKFEGALIKIGTEEYNRVEKVDMWKYICLSDFATRELNNMVESLVTAEELQSFFENLCF